MRIKKTSYIYLREVFCRVFSEKAKVFLNFLKDTLKKFFFRNSDINFSLVQGFLNI